MLKENFLKLTTFYIQIKIKKGLSVKKQMLKLQVVMMHKDIVKKEKFKKFKFIWVKIQNNFMLREIQ